MVARKVWILAEKATVEQSDIDNAILNGCSEIANGIPPTLQGIISESQLPYAYEEPESPKPETIDWQAEWDGVLDKDKIKVLAKMLGIKVA